MRTLARLVRRAVVAAVPAFVLVLSAAPAGAATITWGSPTNIAGDADVSTTGTLVGAFNLSGPAAVVNGVNFQEFLITGGSTTVGNFTVASGFIFDSSNAPAAAPFNTLSAGYQSMLGTRTVWFGGMTLTMSGLTVGQTYEFQAWVNDPDDYTQSGGTFQVDVTGGASTVTLDPNPGLALGGLGQFVTGTFVADATTQDVGFFNGEVGLANGFQLRQIDAINPPSGPGAVPLPAAVWAGLALGAAVVGRRAVATM